MRDKHKCSMCKRVFGSHGACQMHIDRMHPKKDRGIARAVPATPRRELFIIPPNSPNNDFDQLMKMMGWFK